VGTSGSEASRVHGDLHLSAEQVGEDWSAALVEDHRDVEAGRALEHLGAEVRAGARAANREV